MISMEKYWSERLFLNQIKFSIPVKIRQINASSGVTGIGGRISVPGLQTRISCSTTG